jgi:hypothetical protein
MDKSFIIFLMIGAAFFYFVINVVKDTEMEDDPHRNAAYQQENRYAQYMKTDSIGQDILDVSFADPATQTKAWNASPLKEEFLEIFPDFDTMKGFVKNRVRGEELVQKLIGRVNTVEDKFFSGTISAEQAKHSLEKL